MCKHHKLTRMSRSCTVINVIYVAYAWTRAKWDPYVFPCVYSSTLLRVAMLKHTSHLSASCLPPHLFFCVQSVHYPLCRPWMSRRNLNGHPLSISSNQHLKPCILFHTLRKKKEESRGKLFQSLYLLLLTPLRI